MGNSEIWIPTMVAVRPQKSHGVLLKFDSVISKLRLLSEVRFTVISKAWFLGLNFLKSCSIVHESLKM